MCKCESHSPRFRRRGGGLSSPVNCLRNAASRFFSRSKPRWNFGALPSSAASPLSSLRPRVQSVTCIRNWYKVMFCTSLGEKPKPASHGWRHRRFIITRQSRIGSSPSPSPASLPARLSAGQSSFPARPFRWRLRCDLGCVRGRRQGWMKAFPPRRRM